MGILQIVMGGGKSPFDNLDGSAVAIAGVGGKPANAEIHYNTDGSITDGGVAVGGSHHYAGPSNWYEPTTSGIGSSYYIRFTITDDPNGALGASPDFGTIAALSSMASISCGADAGEDHHGEALVEIFYDSGGTALAASGILTFDGTGS